MSKRRRSRSPTGSPAGRPARSGSPAGRRPISPLLFDPAMYDPMRPDMRPASPDGSVPRGRYRRYTGPLTTADIARTIPLPGVNKRKRSPQKAPSKVPRKAPRKAPRGMSPPPLQKDVPYLVRGYEYDYEYPDHYDDNAIRSGQGDALDLDDYVKRLQQSGKW